MREVYLDIIERSLYCYTRKRIHDFINEVKERGLWEHGFPRLGANIGILLANGRAVEYYPEFVEIMDICAVSIPRVQAANDFSVREVVCALALLEKKGGCDKALIEKWKREYSAIDPWKTYSVIAKSENDHVHNWAMFSAVSEFVRCEWCGKDSSEFVDRQIASQLLSVNPEGLYKDPGCPMVYDLVTRSLMAALLRFGYRGRHRGAIEELLDKSCEITLKMQSTTGEIPYGGRSSQFLMNEPLMISYFEMEAARFAEKKDLDTAGKLRAAARLSAHYTLNKLSEPEVYHVKNRYDRDSMIGCEPYAYFNKYMITAASNTSFAYYFSNEDIKPSVAPCEVGGYVALTGEDFHKLFINGGGYFLELDTCADFHYDASGLGRVHKAGCASQICLSTPFPPPTESIKLEEENLRAMSLCVWCESGDEILYGSQKYARYDFVSGNEGVAVVDCTVGDKRIRQIYSATENGVDIAFLGEGRLGFMLPALLFDGEKYSEISVEENCIKVKYNGCVCTYTYDGNVLGYEVYYNRNGRYRVFRVETGRVNIKLEVEREI